MRKKFILILVCIILVFTLAGCGGSSSDDKEETTTQEETEESTEEESNEEESVVDQIEKFDCSAIEDGIIFWNVYMKEDANYDHYMDEEYAEILKACLSQPENKEDGINFYCVDGWTSDGSQLLFAWDDYETEEIMRQVTQYVWRSNKTNPDTYDWLFTGEEMQEIYSGLDEYDE